MITDDINEAEEIASKYSTPKFTEFICPNCNKSFFHIWTKDDNVWANYGLWRHTTCKSCSYTKIGNSNIQFKEIIHLIYKPPQVPIPNLRSCH